MAITTDTGAKKIEGTENWRNIFGIHNDTVDAYDALAEQKDEEIGIVVKGNKTAHTGGAAAGQYIILRNSTITGCDDGLYTAAQAIPYDTVIDSTYLTAVSGGGLNALNASLAKNVLGTVINIESYNSQSNLYTIPYDGYIKLTADGGAGNYSSFFVGSLRLGLARTYDGGNAAFSTVYVRAGMQIYVDKTNTVHCHAEYIPFT